MEKLQKFRNRLISFMQGRNGIDEIFKACIVIYFALYIVNLAAHSLIISLIMTAVFAYSVYRAMSRKTDIRREENARFIMLTGRIRKRISMFKTMLTDKTRVYKKCPGCRNIMRIPKVPGEHTVKCSCGQQMRIKIRDR